MNTTSKCTINNAEAETSNAKVVYDENLTLMDKMLQDAEEMINNESEEPIKIVPIAGYNGDYYISNYGQVFSNKKR